MDSKTGKLTEEQKKRIETNRRLAIEKLSKNSQIAEINNNKAITSKNAFDAILKAGKNIYDKKLDNFLDKKYSSNHSSGASKDTLLKLTLTLKDTKEFCANFPFDINLVNLCKSINGRRYEISKKIWIFPLKEYATFLQKFRALSLKNCQLIEIPKTFLELLSTIDDNRISQLSLEKISSELLNKLMPFQLDAVKFAIANSGRILIADDMGLGKTIQALAIACNYYDEWPLLIVTPSSLRHTWKESICHWLTCSIAIAPCDINVIYSLKDYNTKRIITIVSYDQLSKFIGTNNGIKFNVLIADESHYLKNMKASRTQAFMKVAMNCKRIILLSGTPALSRPKELYPQIKCIAPTMFSNFHNFGVRYCNAFKTNYGWNYDGCSNVDELKFILQTKIMIRRLKIDVTHDLPPKTRKIIYLDPLLIDHSVIKQCNDRMKTRHSKASLRSIMLEYFSLTAKAKAKSVCEYIQDMIECEQKFIIFAHHQFMLNSIEDFLKKNKCEYIRIDGSTQPQMKQDIVNSFQNDSNILVALLSIKSISTGITITSASAVIFAELFWNPGVLAQAEDRIYRIGQKSPVTAIYLIAKSTSDDYMWPLIRNKLQILQGVGVDSHDISSGLTIDLMDSTKITIDKLFSSDSIDE